MIPTGPYPPPSPNYTWLGWLIVGVFVVLPLTVRLATSLGKRQQRGGRR